jgi:hypothetical protein
VKKTDIEKNKALKLTNSLKQAAPHGSSRDAAPKIDRREQRRLDQAQGLVPFACKLEAGLVQQLQALAADHAGGMTGLLNEILQAHLPTPKAEAEKA